MENMDISNRSMESTLNSNPIMVMVFTTADTEVIPTEDMENPITEEAMEAENTTEEVMVDTEVATDTEVNPNTEELQDMAEAIRTEELRETEVGLLALFVVTGRKMTSSTKMDTSLQMKIKNEIKP
jgi:hypothetical protein